MPAYPWLSRNKVDADILPTKMQALRKVGVPYRRRHQGRVGRSTGQTEMDALIALQGLGLALKKRKVTQMTQTDA